MRYPVPLILWLIPPLWPFAALMTLLWLLTFWMSWLILHFVVTMSLTISFAAVGTHWTLFYLYAVPWVLFAAHFGAYVWWRSGRRHRQYELDVAAARYWNQVHADARY